MLRHTSSGKVAPTSGRAELLAISQARVSELEASVAELEAKVAGLQVQLGRHQKMALAISGSPRACMVADAEDGFRLFYLNAAAEAVFDRLAPYLRVPRDRVVGSRIDEVLGAHEFAPAAVSSLRSSISGIFNLGDEWLDLYLAPVLDEAGSLIALFIAGSVVTAQRKRGEAIAAESEEMRASIAEISRNAHRAATTAADASRTAKAANDTVTKLAQSSAGIGGVIEMIDRIAGQTRLLALNATIEAARVGEAGRGFAVVAGEVKQLAQETAGATAEVKQRIEGIQAQASEAVEAIGMILGIVDKIDETQAAIASAVEQQTATTAELSRHLVESMP
jgi:hypothetical protein